MAKIFSNEPVNSGRQAELDLAKCLRFFSRTISNLNTIYVIQWFLIPITYVLIVCFNRDIVFGDGSPILIALLEMVASTLFASGYKKISI